MGIPGLDRNFEGKHHCFLKDIDNERKHKVIYNINIMITLKQDIEEDLYDGQVLQKLIEKLSGEKLSVPGIYTHLLIVESILNYF